MAVILAANALTTLETVEDELGLTLGQHTADDYINRLINTYSAYIEERCQRTFGQSVVIDEKVTGFGTRHLMVKIYPVDTGETTVVKYDDSTVDATQYEWVDDGEWGAVFNLGGAWYWGAARAPNIAGDPVAGSERAFYKVSYTGGFVLPKDWNGTDDFRLPYDLENLCIEMSTTHYRHRGQSRDIETEKLLTSTVKYFDRKTNPEWEAVLNRYMRPDE